VPGTAWGSAGRGPNEEVPLDSIRIPLANGRGEAIIDATELHRVEIYSWHIQTGRTRRQVSYAITDIGRRTLYMHTLITGFPRVDHVNGDGLDNRWHNMREATRSQNRANGVSNGGSSQFKGVWWETAIKRWRAAIRIDGRLRHLGCFHDEVEAARAYDAAARETWGTFAWLNFP
jgi:DNA-binding PadR family transcriptional regulator